MGQQSAKKFANVSLTIFCYLGGMLSIRNYTLALEIFRFPLIPSNLERIWVRFWAANGSTTDNCSLTNATVSRIFLSVGEQLAHFGSTILHYLGTD